MFSSQGQPTPFSNILDPCDKNYFLSLKVLDKNTGLYYFKDPEVEKAAERAVISLFNHIKSYMFRSSF
jgi:hypothetical protein